MSGENGRIALDSAPIIYHLQAHPRYAPALLPVFRAIEQGSREGCASTLALLEVLVGPYRSGAGPGPRQAAALLASYPNLEWVDMDLDIAHRAAEYRARYGLRTPDAIHVATAVQARAEVFLTNDRRLRRVEEIDVLLVEDLEGEDV